MTMPKIVGPTIARWRLGEELARLREAAGLSFAEAGDHLDCSESRIRKLESGHLKPNRAELIVLLDLFGVQDGDLRDSLKDLQRLGNQRGWWAQFGTIPGSFATYLSLEGSATTIRIFEQTIIHGLLQTADYARALAAVETVNTTADRVDRQVEIRMARQERVLADNPPDLWVILDEAALRRVVGGPEVMREQLRHLVELSTTCTLQVIPYGQGAHPGMFGAFTIFDFDEDMHSPVVYVEGPAGNLYLEKASDLSRCSMIYNQLTARALSPQDSMSLLADVAEETSP